MQKCNGAPNAAERLGQECLFRKRTEKGIEPMAQLMVSWFIYDGRFRVHAINAVGRRCGRIIEIEDIDTGKRVHGSARRLERLVQGLSKLPQRAGSSRAMDA
jgi:hypothetical protein